MAVCNHKFKSKHTNTILKYTNPGTCMISMHWYTQQKSLNSTYFCLKCPLFVSHRTNRRQEELSVMTFFENDTDCAFWRQWISTNCSYTTPDDHQLDDVIFNYTTSDQSKSRSNSVNWYPLTALLVLPVIVIIVCGIVLRKRYNYGTP